jgi:hypothetical protein
MCRDAFIYEYVGDVVSNPSFIKRMREYAEEGIKHFYFMMLQKDEVRGVVDPVPLSPHSLSASSSTRRNAVVSAGSRTIHAIRTATSQSGPSDNTSEWAFSRIARSRSTRSSRSTITSIATGEFRSSGSSILRGLISFVWQARCAAVLLRGGQVRRLYRREDADGYSWDGRPLS